MKTSCSKSRKRNRRRQAAKSEDMHKNAEICSLDDKDETDGEVFELSSVVILQN